MSTVVLMKKELMLNGLTCAHCASVIDEKVKHIDGVKNSNLNFTNKKLSVEIDCDNEEKIIKNIIVISFFSILLFSIRGCSQITYKTSKKTTSIEVQCEEISPNGKYKAISYIFTDGGATVSFRRGISIIDANEEKVEEFLKDNEPNIYLNNNSGKEVIDIQWEDNKTLKVNFNNVKENEYYTRLKVEIFNGIKIEYNY